MSTFISKSVNWDGRIVKVVYFDDHTVREGILTPKRHSYALGFEKGGRDVSGFDNMEDLVWISEEDYSFGRWYAATEEV